MSADDKREHRAHRLAWWIALGLFIPLIGTLAVVAFWPYPSPKPYRDRALALMQGKHSALDLERGKQAALEIMTLNAEMELIRQDVLDTFNATNPPATYYRDGTPRTRRADSYPLMSDSDPERAYDNADRELARELIAVYRKRGIVDRLHALSNTPILWKPVDPAKPLFDSLKMIDERGAVRAITRDLCANFTLAAQAANAEAAGLSCRAAFQYAALPSADNTLIGELVAMACRRLVIDIAARVALDPETDADVIRALLEACNDAPPQSDISSTLECDRNTTIEQLLEEAKNNRPIDRIVTFATRQPGPRDWIVAFNRLYDVLGASASSTDFRADVDLSPIPDYKVIGLPNLSLHDHCTGLQRLLRARITFQTQFDATRLLLAITLYQRDHHNTPPRALADLVPDYLSTLPQDPYAPDHQFRYRVLEPREANQKHARFTLYSVGYDATDNNATPPIGARDSLEPLSSDNHPNTDAIFHPRPARPQ